ncbi:hypothetical protein ZPAH1_orf00021 [Aeromonas phage ZPAH1]|nr:hypothetical protein ZPAH1_orf00021 [Aeromonas phage ZPAH1]
MNNEVLKNSEFGIPMELVSLTKEVRKELNDLVKGNIQGRNNTAMILTLLYGTDPDLGWMFSTSRYVRVIGTIQKNSKSSIGFVSQKIYEELEKYENFLKSRVGKD